MEKSKRIDAIIISIFVGAMFIVTVFCVFSQYTAHQFPSYVRADDYRSVPKSHYDFNVDQVTKRNAKYDYVSGWLIVPKTKILQYNTKLVLYRPGVRRMLVFKTSLVKRPDVSAHFDDGLDYQDSGFAVAIPSNYLKRAPYRIGFLVDVGRETRLFKTNVPYQLTREGE